MAVAERVAVAGAIKRLGSLDVRAVHVSSDVGRDRTAVPADGAKWRWQ